MSVTTAYLKTRVLALLAAVALCCGATSCDSAIYDDEGDCSTTYRVTFRYDRNMERVDAFANEVKSVRLYAFDKGGTLVWQQSDSGEALKAEDYSMKLDLPAGDYLLVAWCGLDNEAGSGETFTVPEAVVGKTRVEDLRCALSRQRGASGEAVSKAKLHPLYHGMRQVSLPAAGDDGGDYSYEMNLTKDTNHVRVILQQLSGEPVSADDFNFSIVEANGLMNYDNTLLPDETIRYQAYATSQGSASLGIDDYREIGSAASKGAAPAAPRAITSVSVAIADLYIARLMADRDAVLVIEPKNGGHVDRIPITDYALMLKDGNDGQWSDQDYLDCQDEYALTLFLDEQRKWIGTSIIINAWKLVINNVDFGKEEPAN